MIDHELAWIDPQTILDPSMQILSRIQSSVGFPTMADIDFIIARDSILVAAHLLQLAEKIGHGDKRYTELLKVSFSEYPSGVAAARLSEAMFDSDARDHAESWMAVAVCLRVDAALLHHIGKNRIEKGNGDIARKFLEAAVGRDPHPSTLALLAELAPGLDEKKRLLSDAFHRNSRVDWIACRYAEALFESNESKLARSIVEEILLRNSVYGPAKRLLDRIESES
ncbi:MAG: hypothetical protein H6819_13005 [Phycisphaerales bacterium]|nr:hypothetical protein [Phycisphaerales bacterium]MCB9856752.1 hypothetical protein [Phycisphaerales bacterium]MCB9862121.1 hypothetical protein [Phycisphaerales bacterium]